MRVAATLFLALAVSACAEAPRLNLPAGPEVGTVRLQPAGPLLARADALAVSPASAPDLAASLQSRAAALRARAARLRGPVIPQDTRARMRAAAGRSALP